MIKGLEQLASPSMAKDVKVVSLDSRVTRDAFLFMTPNTPSENDQFAQCISCRMYVPESFLGGELEGNRCIIHGSRQNIDGDDSCGLYVAWPTPNGASNPHVVRAHAEELLKIIPGSVNATESGLVSRKVQCHRCKFSKNKATTCGLYGELNSALPMIFNLDVDITPNSCCNAQEV